jgi:putative Mn2+ efflux pump MntP
MAAVTIIILAIALAADAFAVSITSGAAYKKFHIGRVLRMALFFGTFQAVMPLIGSLAGLTIRTYITHYDHWIAFGLLCGIGGKMIYESFKIKTIEQKPDPTTLSILLVLSVATSIDALAAGITLPFIKVPVAAAVIVIGLVTFVLSYIGVYIGKRIGHFFENKIELLGGVVLIGIGLKILTQHLFS